MAKPPEMSQSSKKEYVEKMRSRYQRRGREARSRLLDEVCEMCGYSRKHAIKLMNCSLAQPSGRRGRNPIYGAAELAVIKPIWLAANQPCGKLLAPLLPLWLEHWEVENTVLDGELRSRLEKISASTLDRLLAPVRATERRRRNSGTKPGSLIKSEIPIRTDNDDIEHPGYLEADTVAHCGGRLEGDFVWTVDMTDVHSQWTECRAVWNKGQYGVVEQVAEIESVLPFDLLGFDSDNGSEFLNWHLVSYLQDRGERPKVAFTRSRPYRKNDNARVEQKNWTHARQLVGYDRLGNPGCVAELNAAYRAWCALKNYFTPVMKLQEKTRVGGRYRKRYDTPRTPARRLLEWKHLPPEGREAIETRLTELNPFELNRTVERHLARVFELARNEPEDDTWLGSAGSTPEPSADAEDTSAPPAEPSHSPRAKKRTQSRKQTSTKHPAPVSSIMTQR